MTKLFRKQTQVVVAFVLALILSVAPISQVVAATYTKDDMILSITNGMAVLTVGGNETYQLTKALITKDGGIDSIGTIYLIWMSKSIYWYNYKYQKNNINLQLLDKDVISFTTDNNGNINGYETVTGPKSLLKEEEIKTKLGIDSNTNNGNTNNGNTSSGNTNNGNTNNGNTSSGNTNNGNTSNGNTNNGNTNNGNNQNNNDNKKVTVENNAVIYRNNGYGYVLSQGSAVDKAAEDNSNTVYIRYTNGKIKFWNYDLQKGDSNIQVKLYDLTNESNGLVIDANGKAIGWYDRSGNIQPLLNFEQIKSIIAGTFEDKSVSYTNNNVIFKAIENGVTKSYVLKSNVVLDKVQKDKNNTVWIRNINGKLDIWNYDLQKSESEIKLHTVTDKSTALVVENGLVVGYYVSGSTVMLPILSLEEIKEIINPTINTQPTQPTQPNKPTENVTKKTKYAYGVKANGYYLDLYNSKGKRVDRVKFKDGKVNYHGIVSKNIQKVAYNEKGNIMLNTKKGGFYTINHNTLEKKLRKKSGISHFNYTSRGLARYAVRNSGTRFSIKKY